MRRERERLAARSVVSVLSLVELLLGGRGGRTCGPAAVANAARKLLDEPRRWRSDGRDPSQRTSEHLVDLARDWALS